MGLDGGIDPHTYRIGVGVDMRSVTYNNYAYILKKSRNINYL